MENFLWSVTTHEDVLDRWEREPMKTYVIVFAFVMNVQTIEPTQQCWGGDYLPCHLEWSAQMDNPYWDSDDVRHQLGRRLKHESLVE